ncbi:hypothetical protein LSAT2_031358, partial [Lamellibrachia satsuma]
ASLFFTLFIVNSVTTSPTKATEATSQISPRAKEPNSIFECTTHCNKEYHTIVNACVTLEFRPSWCGDIANSIRDTCINSCYQ